MVVGPIGDDDAWRHGDRVETRSMFVVPDAGVMHASGDMAADIAPSVAADELSLARPHLAR